MTLDTPAILLAALACLAEASRAIARALRTGSRLIGERNSLWAWFDLVFHAIAGVALIRVAFVVWSLRP